MDVCAPHLPVLEQLSRQASLFNKHIYNQNALITVTEICPKDVLKDMLRKGVYQPNFIVYGIYEIHIVYKNSWIAKKLSV